MFREHSDMLESPRGFLGARGYLDVGCLPGVEHDSALLRVFDRVGRDRGGRDEMGAARSCSPDPLLVSRSHGMLGLQTHGTRREMSRNLSGNGSYDSREVRVLEQQIHCGSQAGSVVMIEAGQQRTIEIENAQQPPILDQWNDDL